MTGGALVSLAITWLSIGPASFSSDISPDATAHRIAEAAWGVLDTQDLAIVDRLRSVCSHPKVIVLPPRPGDPLQPQLVTRLADELRSLDIDVIDGERLQASQERDADLVYAETSDPAAASRILLAKRGDFELSWRLEVAIEGPKDLYGVETWEARGEAHLTLISLRVDKVRAGLDDIEVVATARQRTREEALDQSIKKVTSEIASRIRGPILQDWYGFAMGGGIVLVDATEFGNQVGELKKKLEQLDGVRSVSARSPGEPGQLLVRGSRTAPELAAELGWGPPVSCHYLKASPGGLGWWLAIPIVIGAIAVVGLLVARRRPPPPGGLAAA